MRSLRNQPSRHRAAPLALATLLLLTAFARAQARPSGSLPDDPSTALTSTQASAQPDSDGPGSITDSPTLFPHSTSPRYLIQGQANIIFQSHAPFHSPYEGTNSFLGRGEYKVSLLGTLYLGARLLHTTRTNTEALFNLESSGGRGLSEALGIAGFTNLDVVRNPSLGSVPYMARVQLHQTIGFTTKQVPVTRTLFSLATEAPERRLELHIGKMSLPDFVDLNGSGSDSHLQFMNWTADNNGAWDYAADTRGYTYGVVAEYIDRTWAARYAVALMPTVANGVDLDWALRRASGQNVEVDLKHSLAGPLLPAERKGTLRLLGYANHADMGLYRNANQAFLSGVGTRPDITTVQRQSSVKYGFGLNFEQELTADLNLFGRFGWNEGQHESWAYTEVDQTIELGSDLDGKQWRRPNDKLGLVFISNAIKRDHQAYLALGGHGFLLGDGALHYAREDIVETYYNLHTWRGVFYALDAQFIEHPGYNQDRGPVLVESVRMHVDF